MPLSLFDQPLLSNSQYNTHYYPILHHVPLFSDLDEPILMRNRQFDLAHVLRLVSLVLKETRSNDPKRALWHDLTLYEALSLVTQGDE